MEVGFNEVTKEEFSEVLDMMADFYEIDNYPFDRPGSMQNLEHFIADKNLGRIWLIICDQVTAGYLILTFGFSFEHNGRDAFIDELFLKPEFRSRGIGKIVMKFIDSQARQLGINVVHLEVEQHNAGGNNLYWSMGYRSNGRALLSKKMNAK